MERPPIVLAIRGVIRKGEKFLLLKRATKDNHYANLWELPGGKVDFGQLIDKALKREIKEECGLDVSLRKPIFIWNEILNQESKYAGYLYLNLFCECWLKNEDQTPKISFEHAKIKWLTLKQISRLKLTPGTLETLQTFDNQR
jgi:8-oxo-dGTP diphosphatase